MAKNTTAGDGSVYNENTNWENERKYLTNLAKSGNNWAKDQLGALEAEYAKYNPSTPVVTTPTTPTTQDAPYTPGYVGTYYEDIFADPTNPYNSRVWIPGSGWSSATTTDGKLITSGLEDYPGSLWETADGIYEITGKDANGNYLYKPYTGKTPGTVKDYSVFGNMYDMGYNSASIGQMVQDYKNGIYGQNAPNKPTVTTPNISTGGSTVTGGNVGSVTNVPTTNGQNALIEALFKAQQDAALAELKSAYDENVLTLDAAAKALPAQFQNARNRASADAAVAGRNFNQYAAANGLNTGAAGQAQLAMNNQLIGDLSEVSQAEATAMADLELERAKLKANYQNSVAKAIADGDLAKAQALYEEAVRVDEMLISQAYQNAQLELQRQQLERSIANDEFDKNLALAKQLMAMGDTAGAYALLGYDAPLGYNAPKVGNPVSGLNQDFLTVVQNIAKSKGERAAQDYLAGRVLSYETTGNGISQADATAIANYLGWGG